MAEKFEVAPVKQAVEENHGKLNLVELSGLGGKTFSRAAHTEEVTASTNAAQAAKVFDYVRLGENAVLAGMAGFKAEMPVALERQMMNVNRVVKSELPTQF